MKIGKWFAVAIIILNVAASIGYLLDGDWKRGIYWACSSILIATVTF